MQKTFLSSLGKEFRDMSRKEVTGKITGNPANRVQHGHSGEDKRHIVGRVGRNANPVLRQEPQQEGRYQRQFAPGEGQERPEQHGQDTSEAPITNKIGSDYIVQQEGETGRYNRQYIPAEGQRHEQHGQEDSEAPVTGKIGNENAAPQGAQQEPAEEGRFQRQYTPTQ